MSYIEKEKLIKADIASIENRVRHAFNQGYDLGYKEGKANCSKNSTGSITKNDLGVDCISRADAIKAMQDKAKRLTNEDTINGLCGAVAILFDLPSVTLQEPKTGHWVHGEYCSECGCDVPAYIVDWKWQKDMDAKYCPNCGCRMVEPQEVRDKE